MLHTVARCNSNGNQINRFDRFDHLITCILESKLCHLSILGCVQDYFAFGLGGVGWALVFRWTSSSTWVDQVDLDFAPLWLAKLMLLCSGLTTPNLAVRLCLRRALAPELSCGRPRGKHLHLLQIPLRSISFSHLGRCFVWTLKCIRLGIPVHIKKMIMITFHRIWESGTLSWVLRNRWRRGVEVDRGSRDVVSQQLLKALHGRHVLPLDLQCRKSDRQGQCLQCFTEAMDPARRVHLGDDRFLVFGKCRWIMLD